MPNRIILLSSTPAEKSPDGKGTPVQGVFTINGTTYNNCTLANGAVYSAEGVLLGAESAGEFVAY